MTWWMPFLKAAMLALINDLIDKWVPEPYAHRIKAVLKLALTIWALIQSFRQIWRAW